MLFYCTVTYTTSTSGHVTVLEDDKPTNVNTFPVVINIRVKNGCMVYAGKAGGCLPNFSGFQT